MFYFEYKQLRDINYNEYEKKKAKDLKYYGSKHTYKYEYDMRSGNPISSVSGKYLDGQTVENFGPQWAFFSCLAIVLIFVIIWGLGETNLVPFKVDSLYDTNMKKFMLSIGFAIIVLAPSYYYWSNFNRLERAKRFAKKEGLFL